MSRPIERQQRTVARLLLHGAELFRVPFYISERKKKESPSHLEFENKANIMRFPVVRIRYRLWSIVSLKGEFGRKLNFLIASITAESRGCGDGGSMGWFAEPTWISGSPSMSSNCNLRSTVSSYFGKNFELQIATKSNDYFDWTRSQNKLSSTELMFLLFASKITFPDRTKL